MNPSYSDFIKKFNPISLPHSFEKEVELSAEMDSVMVVNFILKYDPNEAGYFYKDLKEYGDKFFSIGFFLIKDIYFLIVQNTSASVDEIKLYAFNLSGNYISKLVIYEHSGDCAFVDRKCSIVDSLGIKITSIYKEWKDCDDYTILKNDSVTTHYVFDSIIGFREISIHNK